MYGSPLFTTTFYSLYRRGGAPPMPGNAPRIPDRPSVPARPN